MAAKARKPLFAPLASSARLSASLIHPGGILILDFGSQYTQLIARRICDRDVFSAVVPCTAPLGHDSVHLQVLLL